MTRWRWRVTVRGLWAAVIITGTIAVIAVTALALSIVLRLT